MNRQQLHNRASISLANAEAVRLLAQLLALTSDPTMSINPEFVVQSLTCDLARTDPTGAVNLEEALNRFGAVLSTLAAEIAGRVDDMADARHDLQDWRHERYKLSLPSRGAGHGDIGAVPLPESLAALPPPVRAHVLARYGRELRGSDARALDRMRADGDAELADAMQAEINDRGAIASENGSALIAARAFDNLDRAMSKPKPRYFVGNELDNHEVERLEVER